MKRKGRKGGKEEEKEMRGKEEEWKRIKGSCKGDQNQRADEMAEEVWVKME